ncbi:MAG: energy transducer TonB [Gemmatimonadaceae bacterium]
MRSFRLPCTLALSAAAAMAACADAGNPSRLASALRRDIPDEVPALLNAELPFRYPAELYLRRVQGNVTLQLYVDSTGRVVPDSTRVEEPSGYAGLDSAAVRGARELRFAPAKRGGAPMAVGILFPVYFRHPEAKPLPGDSVLQTPP